MTFIDIIVRKKRENYLEAIAEDFVRQYKAHKNILTAVVTSASGLDDKAKKAVAELVKVKGSEVELLEKTDPSIIGGLIVRVGDKQVDASIQRKLNDLKQEFFRK